jgi:hypothetical protein
VLVAPLVAALVAPLLSRVGNSPEQSLHVVDGKSGSYR